MVVFTCQHCGSSLNKNKVEKHYIVGCRNNPHVTCVDCLKDFRGNEYVAHTQCMTEEQRYAAKGFVAKTPPSVKKRATWLNSVESSLNSPGLTHAQKNLIQNILKHSNIPQKKKKFHNFVKSAFGRQFSDLKLVDSVFDIMEKTHKKNVENEKAESISAVDNNSKLDGNKENNAGHKNEEDLLSVEREVEANGELNGETEKMKKKKNKKVSLTETENNQTTDNENSVEVESSQDISANGVNNSGKKKKRKRSVSESEIHQNANVENSIPVDSQDITANGVNNSNGVILKSDQKLSKKELKALKKRAKYEAELNEIENNKNIDEGVTNDENVSEIKKKKKKNKNKDIERNLLDTEVNGVTKDKKNKRHNEDNNNDEPLTKKSKKFDSETLNKSIEPNEEGQTFNWNETIIKVLESRSDKELPVKRLCKKIINEYQAVFGENHMTYEKLLSKFNKKLHKTPNVRVLKDKVKLMT